MSTQSPNPEGAVVVPIYGVSGQIAHALIDASDGHLCGRSWQVDRGYAFTRESCTRRKQYLHRLVLGLEPGDGLEADHVNGDRFDCRRANLRIVTHAQNGHNMPSQGGSSRYRGVSWERRRNRWVAYGALDGRRCHVGYFASEEEAASAVSAWRLAHLAFTNEDRRELATP